MKKGMDRLLSLVLALLMVSACALQGVQDRAEGVKQPGLAPEDASLQTTAKAITCHHS